MGNKSIGLVIQAFVALSVLKFCDNCKYPNLNMKFDIRKIVERKFPFNYLDLVVFIFECRKWKSFKMKYPFRPLLNHHH